MRARSSGRRLPFGAPGARRVVLARAVAIASFAMVALSPCRTLAGERFADGTGVLIGAGGGVTSVDLPDVNDPTRTFGSNARVQLDLGALVRSWLELGTDVAFTVLGESDSLNSILVSQGSSEKSAVTHVQAGVVARAKWLRGESRWAPFGRLGAGVAGLWTSAPGGLGGHELDAAWSAGGGLEVYAHRMLVVRAEGQYCGQAAEGGMRHHAAAVLSVLLAIPR